MWNNKEWGEVAGVLAHSIGGRRLLVNEMVLIVNRIQRLDRHDPMRATEEQELVSMLLRERRRSTVPRGSSISSVGGTWWAVGPCYPPWANRSSGLPSSHSSSTIVYFRSLTWAIWRPGGT